MLRRLRNAQKTTKGAPAYSRYVNRRLGKRVFAAVAYKAGLQPNAVTCVSAVLTFAAIVLLAFAPATWWAASCVVLGLAVGYALDAADGQLARLKSENSHSGEWFDHMVDATKQPFLHIATLIFLYRHIVVPSDALLLVPIAFGAIASIMFFGMTLNDQLRRQLIARGGERPAAPDSSLLRSLAVDTNR